MWPSLVQTEIIAEAARVPCELGCTLLPFILYLPSNIVTFLGVNVQII